MTKETLQEIKDDYAKELVWDSFPHLLLDSDGTREMLDRDYNEVAKRYAQSVAEDLRERIAERAKTTCNCTVWNCEGESVDKYSIRNVEIITP